jgi:tubulin--tyrosine ligase
MIPCLLSSLQRYIENPLLLRKRKFHIRAYVLAVSAISVYFYEDVLILCSGTKYNAGNTDNAFAHITNTAYQSQDPGFSEEKCVLILEEMIAILNKQGIENARGKVEKILDDMKIITGELFASYKGEYGVYAPLQDSFEQYGLDFMIDDDFNVFLLEVNPGPDFKQSGKKCEPVVEGFLAASIDYGITGVAAAAADDDASEQQHPKLSLVYHEEASEARKHAKISFT